MATKAKERREERRVSARKMVEKRRSESGWSTYSLPEGIKRWRPKKAGTVRMNIIPFTAGDLNPFADKGEKHFERTYQAHRGIGADENAYLCPRGIKKKPCPICEERARMAKDPDHEAEEVKALRPQDRQAWLVEILSGDGAEPGKVQLYDESLFNFGKQVEAMIANADEGDGYEYFADPKDGFTLKVGYSEESFAGRKYLKATTIEFKPRKEALAKELLAQSFCLDDAINSGVRVYDDLHKILHQTADEDEDEKPKKKAKPAADDDDDDDDEEETPKPKKGKGKTAKELGIGKGAMVEHDDFGECEVMKVSGDGTSLLLEDEDGKEHPGVNPNEVKLLGGDDDEDEDDTEEEETDDDTDEEESEDDDDSDEDDEEEDEPAPKKGGKKKPPVEDDEEEEADDDDDESEEEDEEEESDDDDDDEEEEPAPKKKKK